MKNSRGTELDYVERVGRFWELSGGPRTAGRIIGWLMICDPPHQSAADLVEVLDISSGSVSTLTRQLMTLGMVERITFPGDRSSYFQLREHAWVRLIEGQMDVLYELVALVDAGRTLLPAQRVDRVEELAAVTDFFLAAWPELVDRLRQHLDDRDRASTIAGSAPRTA